MTAAESSAAGSTPATPRLVDPVRLAALVRAELPVLACDANADVERTLRRLAADVHDGPAAEVFRQLLENVAAARAESTPTCQDTGSVWVCLELAARDAAAGTVFAHMDDAVAEAWGSAPLRASVVADALFDRTNTRTNAPAFCDVITNPRLERSRVHLMLKGGGSDNASALFMLEPSRGADGMIDVVADLVARKAANACPPVYVGVAVGGTFDRAPKLAKLALMREIDAPAQTPAHAEMESRIRRAVDAAGCGPAGLGGAPTAMGVSLVTAPCHIAALPVAVNMGCVATRRRTVELPDDCFL